MEEFKVASFSVEKELLENFRKEVKKSPYNQKFVIDKYLRLALSDLKVINEEAEAIKNANR